MHPALAMREPDPGTPCLTEQGDASPLYPGITFAAAVVESPHPGRNAMVRHLVLALLSSAVGLAYANTTPQSLRDAVDRMLVAQTFGTNGKVAIEVGQPDPRLALAACTAIEAFLPVGTRAWGRLNAGVRCTSGANWTAYIPARVRVEGEYLVAARALGRGQVISDADFAFMRGDLTELPPNMITDPQQAIGQSVNVTLAAGQPLRSDWLRAPVAVQQGQTVKLFARGSGFSVSHDGRALATAQSGQNVQVRTGGGQVVSGVARPGGLVEVVY